jgi:hypothetical protein
MLASLFGWRKAPAGKPSARPARLRLEALEDRCVPTTLTVVNTAGSGDGLGGGIAVSAGSSVTVSASDVEHNSAVGGKGGAGGSDGHGIGGGVYNLGSFQADAASAIEHNHASTSNDDSSPEPPSRWVWRASGAGHP